jgi:hypothetical protein
MLSVVMLNAIMLNIVAPFSGLPWLYEDHLTRLTGQLKVIPSRQPLSTNKVNRALVAICARPNVINLFKFVIYECL